MPYIITTTTPDPGRRLPGRWDRRGHTITRRAVATPEGAQEAAGLAIHMLPGQISPQSLRQVLALGEEGGTVGPLHDGTVIEVKRVTTDALMGHVRMREGGVPLAEVIDAYNAAQEAS